MTTLRSIANSGVVIAVVADELARDDERTSADVDRVVTTAIEECESILAQLHQLRDTPAQLPNAA